MKDIKRRKYSNLSTKNQRKLKLLFLKNTFPSFDDIAKFKRETGISRKKINNWFAQKRYRMKKDNIR
jgi:hypothetical protein